MTTLTDAEPGLLTRLTDSPMLVSGDARLGRRFLLEGLKSRGLVKSAQYQQNGIIYSITQAGREALGE